MKALILVFSSTYAMLAGMAYPGSITFKNGDGSSFSAHLQGDPWFHYVVTGSGEIAVLNTTSGHYEYANYDTTGTHPRLVPSGVQVGTSGPHDTITQAQLVTARAQARAAATTPLATATTTGLLQGKIWYRVYRDADVGKIMYRISVNGDASNYKEERIQPTQGTLKSHPLSIQGNRLDVDGGQFYHYTITQMNGYLQVKEFTKIGTAFVFNRVVRWYDNQTDADTYYNSL